MKRIAFAMAACLILSLGCGRGRTPAEKSTDKVVYVPDDDKAMAAAFEKARATVNTFIQALKAQKASQSAFAIKVAFTEGKNSEYMWINKLTYDGTKFHGILDNEPERVKVAKIGQKISIEPAKIADWMYVDNRKLVGGYTIRALRDSVPPGERAAFDKSVPFTID